MYVGESSVGVRNVMMNVRTDWICAGCKFSLEQRVSDGHMEVTECTLKTRRIVFRSNFQVVIA